MIDKRELTTFAEQSGYEWKLVETDVLFLLWDGPIPDGQFPLAGDPFVMTPDKPFPSVVYLRSRPGRRWKQWRRRLHEARDKLHGASPEHLEALRTRAERQIRRYGQQLEPLLQHVRRLLMVWRAEYGKDTHAEAQATEAQATEAQATEARFVRLWNGFQQGVHLDVIERWLPGLPACPVSKFQAEGMCYYTARRERVMKELVPAHRRWWACEALLGNLGEPGESERRARLREILIGPAQEFWSYAYRLYRNNDEDLNRWKDVCEHIWEERADLGLPKRGRHKSFQTFEGSRTNFQSEYGSPS